MTIAGMVLSIIKQAHSKTSFDNISNRLTLRSIKKSSSVNTINTTANLISNSRRGSSVSSCKSAWCKWPCGCSERKCDSFRCSVNYALDFLAEDWVTGQLG